MRRAPGRRRTSALARTRTSVAGLLSALLLCSGTAAVAAVETSASGTTTDGTTAEPAPTGDAGSGLLCPDGSTPDAEAFAAASPEQVETALAAGEPVPGCQETAADTEPDLPAGGAEPLVPDVEPAGGGTTDPSVESSDPAGTAPAAYPSASTGTGTLAGALEITPTAVVSAGAALRGGFEVDGNVTHGDLPGSTGDDWDNVSSDSATDGLNDSTQFSSRDTKENDAPSGWQPGSGTASGQADIDGIWTHDRVDAGTQWLYLGFSRDTGSGSIGYSLELNQRSNVVNGGGVSVPDRTDGDLRVGFTQSGNGPLSLVEVARWSGTATAGSWATVGFSGEAVLGFSNAGSLPATGPFPPMATSTFVEAAFNLSQLDQATTCTRAGFVQANLRSRQSQSMTSQLKDHAVVPVSIPPRCADLTIVKENEAGDVVPGATFTIEPSPLGDDASLVVTDGGADDPDATRDGTISLQTDEFGPYTVTETKAPKGYLLPTARSQTWTAAAYGRTTLTFVDPLGTASWAKVDENGSPVAGATFTLTPTGGDARDLLGADHEVVVADDGADDSDPVAGKLRVEGLYTGTWTLTETGVPTGYDPQRIPEPIVFSVTDESPAPLVGPALDLGDLVNHRLTTVTVVKTVTPRLTPSGVRPPDEPGAEWQFLAEAPAGVTVDGSGITGADGSTVFELSIPSGTDTAVLSVEEGMKPGYTIAPQDGSNAVCSAGGKALAVTDGDPTEAPYGFEVAVPAGSAVTCYVDNRELEVGVDVVKRAWLVPAGQEPADGEELVSGGYAELVFDPDGMRRPEVISGTTVWWSYTVTNTGELDLEDLVVTDDVVAPSADDPICTISSLGAGGSFTCTGDGPVARQ
ncbi:SpaA isopeptide-forming pilin-related protein [Georgenia sp. SUBG003]|uniref:MSCRAMM family protein n=2 Tax=Georgenia sp. SUBG003 TaxID=1497974 RepID=UPI003AB45C73